MIMENNNSYIDQRNAKNIMKLRQIRDNLPPFCSDFFMGIENTTSVLTRLAYAQDLLVFFKFLTQEIPYFEGKDIRLLALPDLNEITAENIEYFLDYLSLYYNNGKKVTNNDKAKARKLATIRTFFKYFYKKNKINQNVAQKVDMPKIYNKNIIRLDNNEVDKLLDIADNGDTSLTNQQKGFHKHTRVRDLAILMLFLGTGIRISELVGINIKDINFDNNSFVITRKGGDQYILYFSNEVANALLHYKKQREQIKTKNEEDNQAFFLSLQNKRITTRAVENLVKKYSKIAAPLKKISPHKLRSTYGTNLYEQTHDIYIVADVLGHKDVNTTKKHYAAINENIRKNASTLIKLRDNHYNDENE